MKNNKFLLGIVTVLIFMFIGNTSAYAYSEKTGTIEKGNLVNFNGSSVVTDYHEEYPNFYYKSSSSTGAFVCASGFGIPVSWDKSCTYSSKFSDANKYDTIGLAYLVNTLTGKAGGKKSPSNTEYYWIEMTTLYYAGKFTNSENENFTKNVINNSDIKMVHTNSTFKQVISAAETYQNKYSKSLDITLSDNDLKFELNDDGYYYSQKVYITDKNSNSDKVSISVDNSNFIKQEGNDSTGKYFQLKIPKSKVLGKRQDVSVTVNASNAYYIANIYYCGSSYQNLLQTITDKKQLSDSAKASGSVSLTELIIKKEDQDGKPLPGAKIKVECSETNYSEIFETTEKDIVLEGMPYCDYKITEESAPDKYIKDNNEYSVELSEKTLSNSVTLTNKLNRLEISKLNIATGDLLPGAILQIRDENDNILYQWESTSEPYVVEGIPAGTYYLVEISAPEGYDLNIEKVKFIVDNSLEVLRVQMINVLHVDVPDTLSQSSAQLISLSMFDVALGVGILIFVKNRRTKKA